MFCYFIKKIYSRKSNDYVESLEDNTVQKSTVRHWKENLPRDLDGISFQSNSLSILVLFLEIETFLLINKP